MSLYYKLGKWKNTTSVSLGILSQCSSSHGQNIVGIAISEASRYQYQSDAEEDASWQLIDAVTFNVTADDYVIIVYDFNGNLAEMVDGCSCYGFKGSGAFKMCDERIIDFADTYVLVLVNT